MLLTCLNKTLKVFLFKLKNKFFTFLYYLLLNYEVYKYRVAY
jgi:hypothetical protein